MKKAFLLLSVVMMLSNFGCSDSQAEGEHSVIKITPEEAKEKLDNDPSIIIVDVRTPDEFNEEHIVNAISLPLDSIVDDAAEVIADKDAVYFIYCHSGNRSAIASAQLISMGYKNIYDLGGILDWPYEKESNNH